MKKRIIIMCGFIILYFVIILLFDFLDNTSKIVYIGDYTRVFVDNGIRVTNDGENCFNKKVKYYFNSNDYYGYMTSVGKIGTNDYHLEVINNNGKIVKFNEDLIAYTPNLDIKLEKPEDMILTSEDFKILTKFLNDNNYDSNIVSSYKNRIDLDNDGNLEEVYSICVGDNYNSLIIFKSEDTITLIDSIISDSDIDNSERDIMLYAFIDFDSDDKYEIVIREDNGDNQPNYYNIYTYDGNTITRVEEE